MSWNAPTENTDGTPIIEALSYRLEVGGVPFLDFPGSLNPDGRFSIDYDQVNLPTGQILTLALRAFYVEDPNLISEPSNSIQVLLGVVQPNPPTSLEAA